MSSSTHSDLAPISSQLDHAQYDLSKYAHALRVQLELEHEERMTDLRELQEDMISNFESLRDEMNRLSQQHHYERVLMEDWVQDMSDMRQEILDASQKVATDLDRGQRSFQQVLQLARTAQKMFVQVKSALTHCMKRNARRYLENRELQ
jgi:hypothetical protein